MTKNKKNKLKKGDLIVILSLLFVAAVLFAVSRAGDGTTAAVTVDGQTVYTADLSSVTECRDLQLDNGVVITVEPGAIFFAASPCRGQDCVRTGRLTRAGQCAVCIPAKTVITITGGRAKDRPDAITY